MPVSGISENPPPKHNSRGDLLGFELTIRMLQNISASVPTRTVMKGVLVILWNHLFLQIWSILHGYFTIGQNKASGHGGAPRAIILKIRMLDSYKRIFADWVHYPYFCDWLEIKVWRTTMQWFPVNDGCVSNNHSQYQHSRILTRCVLPSKANISLNDRYFVVCVWSGKHSWLPAPTTGVDSTGLNLQHLVCVVCWGVKSFIITSPQFPHDRDVTLPWSDSTV